MFSIPFFLLMTDAKMKNNNYRNLKQTKNLKLTFTSNIQKENTK